MPPECRRRLEGNITVSAAHSVESATLRLFSLTFLISLISRKQPPTAHLAQRVFHITDLKLLVLSKLCSLLY